VESVPGKHSTDSLHKTVVLGTQGIISCTLLKTDSGGIQYWLGWWWWNNANNSNIIVIIIIIIIIIIGRWRFNNNRTWERHSFSTIKPTSSVQDPWVVYHFPVISVVILIKYVAIRMIKQYSFACSEQQKQDPLFDTSDTLRPPFAVVQLQLCVACYIKMWAVTFSRCCTVRHCVWERKGYICI
jgi:hypothetical protein